MVVGMDAVGVGERVERIVAVCDDQAASDDLIESALVAVREVQAWADARHGVLVAKLSADSFAEARVAKASKMSLGAAEKATQRSKTLAATPKLAGALGDGATTAAHIDAVTRAAAQVPAAQRNELLVHADGLVAVAAASTPEQFARRVALEAKRIQADDGLIVSPGSAAMFESRRGWMPTGCGTCADGSTRSPGCVWPPSSQRRSRRCSPRRSPRVVRMIRSRNSSSSPATP